MDVQLTDKGTRTADAEPIALGEWESSLVRTMLGIAGVDELLGQYGVVIAPDPAGVAVGGWGVERPQHNPGLCVDFGAIESEMGARLIAALVLVVDQGAVLEDVKAALEAAKARELKRNEELRELHRENARCRNGILQMWDVMGKKRRKRLYSDTRGYAEGLATERDAEAREDY